MKFTEVYITSYYLKQIDVFLAYKIGIEYIKQNPEFIPMCIGNKPIIIYGFILKIVACKFLPTFCIFFE